MKRGNMTAYVATLFCLPNIKNEEMTITWTRFRTTKLVPQNQRINYPQNDVTLHTRGIKLGFQTENQAWLPQLF